MLSHEMQMHFVPLSPRRFLNSGTVLYSIEHVVQVWQNVRSNFEVTTFFEAYQPPSYGQWSSYWRKFIHVVGKLV